MWESFPKTTINFDAILMLVGIDNQLVVYEDIIRYLEGMNFPDGVTKKIRMRIAYKNRSYTLIGQLFSFCGRDGNLCRAVGKAVVSKLL